MEKFIGDAVVGVFGVPVVHEDDPERAVRAGLRIVEALEGMTRPTALGCRLAAASTPVRRWCASTSIPPPAAASSSAMR